MIYLDNAATTKVDPSTIVCMHEYMMSHFGNPSSDYAIGDEAREVISDAKKELGRLINASDPESQIIFTSGGSEGNTMILETAHRLDNKGKDVVISNGEHESVIRAALQRTQNDAEDQNYSHLLLANLKEDGKVDEDHLEQVLKRSDVVLVSCLNVNNETGAINNVKKLCGIAHKYGALFHTDCVQSLSTVPIDVQEIGCDFATFSSHKINGPKGVGAVYVKDRRTLGSIIEGTQEGGLRGGTENVSGIVGFAHACYVLYRDWDKWQEQTKTVREAFVDTLKHELWSHNPDRSPQERIHQAIYPWNFTILPDEHAKILSIRFDDVDSETLLALLRNDVAISAGSACHAREQAPSKALKAMGLSDEEAFRTVRISFSRLTTLVEAIEGAKIIADKVRIIRQLSKM